MPVPNANPDGELWARLREMEKRIRALESGKRAEVYPAADGAKVMIGQLDATGTVGIKFVNSSGVTVLTYSTT